MNQKTIVLAEDEKQEIQISRDFKIPLPLLFKAFVVPEYVEQWMGTKVLKLDSHKHGAYQFETSDQHGNVVLRSHGVIHDLIQNKSIVRTFEMAKTPFPAQLEFLEFESVSEKESRLLMTVVYRSIDIRDQILKMPFVAGINMAHDKLEKLSFN